MTDPELIKGILQRDRKAFHHLVEKYQRNVIKTAYHFLGNMEDAEDLSQEIFLEVIRAVHSFRSDATINTWIYRITVNKSLNQLKKNRRRAFIVKLESIIGLPGKKLNKEPFHTQPDNTEQMEQSRLLYQAIDSLPENQRIAFVLTKFEDQSYKQVSEIMNISLSAVESLIHRARINLQARLENHFSEYKKS